MSGQWHHLPAPARPIAIAMSDAVAAARQREPEAFADATGALGALDASQVALVLGTVVRLLMEDQHPDGLAGDDVREVLERCVRASATWQPDIDPHTLLIVIAGALGVHDPDEQHPPPKPDVLARHAALLVVDLLGTRAVDGYLNRAADEIERTQLND
jgi:hypothetical protein